MTKDTALRLALEALEWSKPHADAELTYQEAITAIKAALEKNEFNPDWDTQAVLVEEIQRMAKRIEELEAKDKPMHPEIKKLYEDYFDKCFRESSSLDKCFRDSFSPQRTLVGLTHAEIDYQAKKDDHGVYFALGALWAEAKLRSKNDPHR